MEQEVQMWNYLNIRIWEAFEFLAFFKNIFWGLPSFPTLLFSWKSIINDASYAELDSKAKGTKTQQHGKSGFDLSNESYRAVLYIMLWF